MEKYNKFIENGLNISRMFGSKSNYKKNNPDNFVIFNARIYDKKIYDEHKNEIKDWSKELDLELWYGDLDLNKDIGKLFSISKDIGTLVVTSESGIKLCEINNY